MLKRLFCLLLLVLLPGCAAAEETVVIAPYEPTQIETDFSALLAVNTPFLLYTYSSAAATTLRANVHTLQDGTWSLVHTCELPLLKASGRMAIQCYSLEDSVLITLQGDHAIESLLWQPCFDTVQPDLTFSTASLCEDTAASPYEEIPLYIQCGDESASLSIDNFAAPSALSLPAYVLTVSLY